MQTTVVENNDGQILQPGISQNMKINKFMEELSIQANKRDIVLLLISIAEKPEVATDFNISLSYYLSLYLRTRDELNLSDAGILILNSSKIYARRVDYVHDDIVKMANGLKEDARIEEKRIVNKVPKKVAQKRSLLEDGNLIEVEMPSNAFKKSTNDKCFVNENDTNLACFDAPKNFFSSYKKFQEYHIFNKKRKKDTNNLTSDFVNPSLWKNSRIFDFDYEDEIDSKRNYRIFKHHIEHRYKTLVNDINFIMYFKVKDFIEAKEEEMRNQTLFDTILENDENWKSKDYTTIENEVLENENKPCEIYFTQSRNYINNNNNNRLGNKLYDPFKKNIVNNNKDCENDSGNYSDFDSQNFSSADAICSAEVSKISQTTDISFNNLINNDENVPDTSSYELSLIEGDNEVFDKNKIIVRLSDDDEGVCFANLDETEKIMLSPLIVTTDIAKYMNNSDLSNLTITVDDNIKNLFGIDESHLTAQKNFVLPEELINTNSFQIEKNIFGFPEYILQKRKNFRLTEDFKLFMEARKHKRQNNATNCPVPTKSMRLDYVDPVEPFDECFRGFSAEDIYQDMDYLSRLEVGHRLDKHRLTSTDSGFNHYEDDIDALPNGTIEDLRAENELSAVQLMQNVLADNSCTNNSTLPNDLNGIVNDISKIQSIDESQSIINTTGLEKINKTDTDINIELDSNLDDIDLEDSDRFISNIDATLNIESHEETNKMIQKIQNWHRHLKPMLAKSKERHHFDIFDLGTEIMDKFSNNSITNNVTFNDVMHDKDPSFTSRYFLSVLLLANTNNIEINTPDRKIFKPVDPDNIKIKLLSRKRHIVSEVDNIGLVSQKRSHTEITEEQVQSVIFPSPPKRSKQSVNADNDSGYNSFNLISEYSDS